MHNPPIPERHKANYERDLFTRERRYIEEIALLEEAISLILQEFDANTTGLAMARNAIYRLENPERAGFWVIP